MKMHFQKLAKDRKEKRMNQSIPWEDISTKVASDDSTLALAAQQNPAAFQPIYQKWLKPIYRYFYFRVGNEKDAEDLTSQVFLKAYEDLPRYRSTGSFSAWLFTIAHARMVDYFRKEFREVTIENAELHSDAPDFLAKAVHDNELDQLLTLLQKLNNNEQELIRLRFFGELSYREIGEILHRREDAVRKSVTRLLDRMQVELEVNND
jgi:RNA polymerase sigma-70 factor (ECF subfamily)